MTSRPYTIYSVLWTLLILNIASSPTANAQQVFTTFRNLTKAPVELFWIAQDGSGTSYGEIAPGNQKRQAMNVGNIWHIKQGTKLLKEYKATKDKEQTVDVKAGFLDRLVTAVVDARGGGERTAPPSSPNSTSANNTSPQPTSTDPPDLVDLTFFNPSGSELQLYVADPDGGDPILQGLIPQKGLSEQKSYPRNVWIVGMNGTPVLTYTATAAPEQSVNISAKSIPLAAASVPTTATVTFKNPNDQPVEVYLVTDPKQDPESQGIIEPGQEATQDMEVGTQWVFGIDGNQIGYYQVSGESAQKFTIPTSKPSPKTAAQPPPNGIAGFWSVVLNLPSESDFQMLIMPREDGRWDLFIDGDLNFSRVLSRSSAGSNDYYVTEVQGEELLKFTVENSPLRIKLDSLGGGEVRLDTFPGAVGKLSRQDRLMPIAKGWEVGATIPGFWRLNDADAEMPSELGMGKLKAGTTAELTLKNYMILEMTYSTAKGEQCVQSFARFGALMNAFFLTDTTLNGKRIGPKRYTGNMPWIVFTAKHDAVFEPGPGMEPVPWRRVPPNFSGRWTGATPVGDRADFTVSKDEQGVWWAKDNRNSFKHYELVMSDEDGYEYQAVCGFASNGTTLEETFIRRGTFVFTLVDDRNAKLNRPGVECKLSRLVEDDLAQQGMRSAEWNDDEYWANWILERQPQPLPDKTLASEKLGQGFKGDLPPGDQYLVRGYNVLKWQLKNLAEYPGTTEGSTRPIFKPFSLDDRGYLFGNYLVPDYFEYHKVIRSSGTSQMTMASSEYESAQQWKVAAEVGGGYKGITAKVSGNYGQDWSRGSSTQNIWVTERKFFTTYWVTLLKQRAKLAPDFMFAARQLLNSDYGAFKGFFERYGTHYPLSTLLGGTSWRSKVFNKTQLTSKNGKAWGFGGEGDIAGFASLKTQMETAEQNSKNTGSESSTEEFMSVGGNGLEFSNFGPAEQDKNLVPLKVIVQPIYELILASLFGAAEPAEQAAIASLRAQMMEHWQKYMLSEGLPYEGDFGPRKIRATVVIGSEVKYSDRIEKGYPFPLHARGAFGAALMPAEGVGDAKTRNQISITGKTLNLHGGEGKPFTVAGDFQIRLWHDDKADGANWNGPVFCPLEFTVYPRLIHDKEQNKWRCTWTGNAEDLDFVVQVQNFHDLFQDKFGPRNTEVARVDLKRVLGEAPSQSGYSRNIVLKGAGGPINLVAKVEWIKDPDRFNGKPIVYPDPPEYLIRR